MGRRAVGAVAVAVATLTGVGGGTLVAERAGVLSTTPVPAPWAAPAATPTSAPALAPASTTTITAPPTLAASFGGVLRIRAVFADGVSVGTGFAIGDGTWMLSNRHVVEGATRLELETWDGRDAGGAVMVGVAGAGVDLALLRLTATHGPVLGLRVERPASDGAVVTAGYPRGRRLEQQWGRILYRVRSGGRTLLLTDIPCEPGCSGSPVLDAEGRVVGVIMGATQQLETLAVPIEDAAELLRTHGIAG